MNRSSGQEQAFQDLEEICALSNGGVSITDVIEPTKDAPSLNVRLGLATRQHIWRQGGLKLRAREPICIYIPASFPHDYPWVDALHTRLAGAPHVQWTNRICLYRSPDIEWSAADGIYGFIERLNQWFGAAAAGILDPDDAPLHPPVVYEQYGPRMVIKADTPDFSETQNVWCGTACLKPIHGLRYDLIDWVELGEKIATDSLGAVAILLGSPFPMEYPSTVSGIISELEKQGIEYTTLYLLMQLQLSNLKDDERLHVVLGTPMRRRDANGPLRQHLSMWRISEEATEALRTILKPTAPSTDAIKAFAKWSVLADVEWCRIDEAREEVTHRRDGRSDASWVKGKRVLLLGCGALGSYSADMLARAGASQIMLVDKGVVNSGILSRQLFRDIDIGRAKAQVCEERLRAISPSCAVEHSLENLNAGVFKKFGRDFDLLIDATASRTVSNVLERELHDDPTAPNLIAMSVSAKAEIGRVMVRPKQFSSGPKSIIRSAKLSTHGSPSDAEFAHAFWPKPGEVELFQPEPGCSDPTFEGSATDIAFHAAGMLNFGLQEVSNSDRTAASVAFLPKPFLRKGRKIVPTRRLDICDSRPDIEKNHAYSVLSAPAAVKTIGGEIARSGRCNGFEVETGGLLFGEIDDSLSRVWVDRVSGPPPDSLLSPALFVCGTDGTRKLTEVQDKQSGGSSRFIGIWHTHPVSPPRPSEVDFGAMRSMLLENENPPRHTVMLIIGHAATSPEWAFYLFRRNEVKNMRQIWRIRVRRQDVP